MAQKRYYYLSDDNRQDGKRYYTASPINAHDYRYYCTNLNGDGLFLVTPYERIQLLGTCDFSCNSLAQFKYKFRKHVKKVLSEATSY